MAALALQERLEAALAVEGLVCENGSEADERGLLLAEDPFFVLGKDMNRLLLVCFCVSFLVVALPDECIVVLLLLR